MHARTHNYLSLPPSSVTLVSQDTSQPKQSTPAAVAKPGYQSAWRACLLPRAEGQGGCDACTRRATTRPSFRSRRLALPLAKSARRRACVCEGMSTAISDGARQSFRDNLLSRLRAGWDSSEQELHDLVVQAEQSVFDKASTHTRTRARAYTHAPPANEHSRARDTLKFDTRAQKHTRAHKPTTGEIRAGLPPPRAEEAEQDRARERERQTRERSDLARARPPPAAAAPK